MQNSANQPPRTYHYDPMRIMATLDYLEMVALSTMFERWALTEEKLPGERRTQLIQWSADFERIALFCGPDWTASEPEEETNLLAFMARQELHAVRSWRQPLKPLGFKLERLRFGVPET